LVSETGQRRKGGKEKKKEAVSRLSFHHFLSHPLGEEGKEGGKKKKGVMPASVPTTWFAVDD